MIYLQKDLHKKPFLSVEGAGELRLNWKKEILKLKKQQWNRDDPLWRAMGRGGGEGKLILDANLGLGADALKFIHYGYQVIGLERQELLIPLLEEEVIENSLSEKIKIYQASK